MKHAQLNEATSQHCQQWPKAYPTTQQWGHKSDGKLQAPCGMHLTRPPPIVPEGTSPQVFDTCKPYKPSQLPHSYLRASDMAPERSA